MAASGVGAPGDGERGAGANVDTTGGVAAATGEATGRGTSDVRGDAGGVTAAGEASGATVGGSWRPQNRPAVSKHALTPRVPTTMRRCRRRRSRCARVWAM